MARKTLRCRLGFHVWRRHTTEGDGRELLCVRCGRIEDEPGFFRWV